MGAYQFVSVAMHPLSIGEKTVGNIHSFINGSTFFTIFWMTLAKLASINLLPLSFFLITPNVQQPGGMLVALLLSAHFSSEDSSKI